MATEIQTCYKHGDRRAGVICQRCDRPICPDCMSQASVGFHCPECTKAGSQRVYTAAALVTRPIVSTVLIGLNVVAFVATRADEGLASTSDYGLFEPFVADGEWYRIITSGFLHANLIHLAFNMWALWILGTMLESAVGRSRFGLIFAAGLIGGSFGVVLVSSDQLTVGASGAVFGLMGAAVAAQRAKGVNPWDTGLGGLLMINLIFTFAIPNISIGGHLGGLMGGFLAGFVYWDVGPRLAHRWLPHAMVGGLTIGLAVVTLAISQPV